MSFRFSSADSLRRRVEAVGPGGLGAPKGHRKARRHHVQAGDGRSVWWYLGLVMLCVPQNMTYSPSHRHESGIRPLVETTVFQEPNLHFHEYFGEFIVY